jgi:hypothetical protein
LFEPFASNPAAKNNIIPPIASPNIMSFTHEAPSWCIERTAT